MIEIIRPGVSARHTRVALFDFDGTLSLIRSGWMDVMIPMMTGILAAQNTSETERELRNVVEDYVGHLTGQETVYQMIALADAVRARGGQPLDPLAYKRIYLDTLWERIKDRVADLRDKRVPPDHYLVPGSRALLEDLKERGFRLYLASGTDEEYMQEEARLLDVERYFDGGVYGALDDYQSFSKAILIQRILSSGEFRGDEFLAFGDGYVEIENVKQVGGVAVGVATAEPDCQSIDEWKRQRLVGAGADYIIPHFLCHAELMAALFAA